MNCAQWHCTPSPSNKTLHPNMRFYLSQRTNGKNRKRHSAVQHFPHMHQIDLLPCQVSLWAGTRTSFSVVDLSQLKFDTCMITFIMLGEGGGRAIICP